jgi:erythromycin esterase-like protein
MNLDSYLFEFNLTHCDSYQYLANLIDSKNIVLLGEATHGSLEFYQIRSALSQYLIKERGFDAICIEGDWPETALINSYINGYVNPNQPETALSKFRRFPQWMWNNHIIVELIRWLRNYNDNCKQHKVHFYGLDLYSLSNSISAVIDYLQETDPEAAEIAIKNYSCFEHTAHEPQEYGALVKYSQKKACIEEVLKQLEVLRNKSYTISYAQANAIEQHFVATQNANLIKNAEHYYRALFDYNANTWNIRDQHMFETLNNVITHLRHKLHREPKIIVWAHNSHLGNAKATEMAERGELNLGQLVKETNPNTSFSLGFSTFSGSVTAADNWGDAPQFKTINPALVDSYEYLFHALPFKDFLIRFDINSQIKAMFSNPKLQRAIGVIYRPETERFSHYYLAKPALQFDAMLHIDRTNALIPG